MKKKHSECLFTLFFSIPFFKCFLVDVIKCDCLFVVWDTQGHVMGQWFLFGSILFASNHCHWLACAHSVPLVHASTHDQNMDSREICK